MNAKSVSLLVIGGLPASGKSILAGRLQAQLRWPLLTKDGFKEVLFDTLGAGDAQWSKQLSKAAYALLFAQARLLLECNKPCIIEGNFRWHEQSAAFASLEPFRAQCMQVMCRAAPDVLVQRFKERAAARHPGHVDLANAADIEIELRQSAQEPLPLPGIVEVCDTTVGWSGAIDTCIARILARMGVGGMDS